MLTKQFYEAVSLLIAILTLTQVRINTLLVFILFGVGWGDGPWYFQEIEEVRCKVLALDGLGVIDLYKKKNNKKSIYRFYLIITKFTSSFYKSQTSIDKTWYIERQE